MQIVPFIFGMGCPEKQIYNLQFQGIVIIGLGIFLADGIAWLFAIKRGTSGKSLQMNQGWLSKIIVISVLLVLIQFSSFNPLLIFESFKGTNPWSVALQREAFATSFGGWIAGRMLNPLLPIFGILAFSGLVSLGKKLLAGMLLVILGGALSLSTAKAPALMLFFACLLFLAYHYSRSWVLPPLFLMFLLPILSFASVFYFYSKLHPSYQSHVSFTQISQGMRDDASDQYRRLREACVVDQTAVTYLAYRLFFVPVGVSSRWYEFGLLPLAEKEANKVGTSGLANAVGRWAYAGRFPGEYLPHVRAYASIDADAFCRFSMAGVLLAALGYMAGRIVLSLSCGGTTDSYLQALYSLGLGIFSFVPYQGSLQAMLGPQGILPIILLGFFLRWVYCQRSACNP